MKNHEESNKREKNGKRAAAFTHRFKECNLMDFHGMCPKTWDAFRACPGITPSTLLRLSFSPRPARYHAVLMLPCRKRVLTCPDCVP